MLHTTIQQRELLVTQTDKKNIHFALKWILNCKSNIQSFSSYFSFFSDCGTNSGMKILLTPIMLNHLKYTVFEFRKCSANLQKVTKKHYQTQNCVYLNTDAKRY